jgi:hypothetical protein
MSQVPSACLSPNRVAGICRSSPELDSGDFDLGCVVLQEG